MAIRLPLKTVGSFTAGANETGASSALGGIAHAFVLPQDTNGVVVKLTASVVGAYSAVFQTTDNGGTTWYDCGRTSIVSNANSANAEWLNIPVSGNGVGTAPIQTTSSVFTASIGKASSVLGNRMTGLPILSQQARVFVRITGDITDADANTYTATVMVNSQSATA